MTPCWSQWHRTYVAAQSGAASWGGGDIYCQPGSRLWLYVRWTAVAETNGSLRLVGFVLPPYDFPLSPNLLIGSLGVGVAAGGVAMRVIDPPPVVALRYDWTAGGDAGQFAAAFELRG